MRRRPSRQEIRDTVHAYSDAFFSGALHDIPVSWAPLSYAGDYEDPSKRYPLGRIRLSSRSLVGAEWRMALLHELVHAALCLADDVDEYEDGEEPWHGPRFSWAVNYLGGRMGLPEAHEEETYLWPFCHFE